MEELRTTLLVYDEVEQHDGACHHHVVVMTDDKVKVPDATPEDAPEPNDEARLERIRTHYKIHARTYERTGFDHESVVMVTHPLLPHAVRGTRQKCHEILPHPEDKISCPGGRVPSMGRGRF
jgi:hypothetical protein